MPSPSPVSSAFAFSFGIRESPSVPSFSTSVAPSAPAHPLFSTTLAPEVPPLPAHLSAPSFPSGSLGAGPVPSSAPLRFPSQAHVPPPGFPLAPSSLAPPDPLSSASSAPPFSFSATFVPPSSFQGSSVVPGLGVGYPLSSGVPSFPPYSPGPFAPAAPPSTPAWPPAAAPTFDPHAYPSAVPPSDPLSDSDDRFPDEAHPPLDPSAPLISLDSSRSECRHMFDFVCGLFPQAAGVPPADPPPRAIFESFFESAMPSRQPLAFNWFERVRTTLVDADSCMAAWLAAGHSDCTFIPPRHTLYAVRGLLASGRAVPVNESLLAHFERPLQPSLQVDLTVRDLMALECYFRAQSESLSYSMWILSGFLGFIRLQGFTPSDPTLFNQLVTTLSKSLAHQAHVSASNTAYACHKRREFYLSHLPAYFTDINKRSMLSSPLVFADSLFKEEDVTQFLDSTRSSSSLRSQQVLVDVASWRSGSSSSRSRRFSPSRSPNRSPARRRRRLSSGSPSRSQKRVRVDSPASSSALKSPRKSHFRG